MRQMRHGGRGLQRHSSSWSTMDASKHCGQTVALCWKAIERQMPNIVPKTAAYTLSASFTRIADASDNPFEKRKFNNLEEGFGWMRYLRLESRQKYASNTRESAKCRWIHCTLKFPDYLQGNLWALSDDLKTVADSMRMLDKAIQRYTRFSKHGKNFALFAQTSRRQSVDDTKDVYPMLAPVPLLGLDDPRSAPTAQVPGGSRERLLVFKDVGACHTISIVVFLSPQDALAAIPAAPSSCTLRSRDALAPVMTSEVSSTHKAPCRARLLQQVTPILTAIACSQRPSLPAVGGQELVSFGDVSITLGWQPRRLRRSRDHTWAGPKRPSEAIDVRLAWLEDVT
ncbi:hypothetical protein DOTSEDRAFT_70627 [Dothistroma septosporum NZE10]|uniref:Uncharacterized protein n=1 Tax=Dothistroma septosporum (strain NZE10 / CBS 128990) TaxID=675120 RepID=N1PTH8_DOTSN|nr:hypothetical protein DOTSEDRAFT_70627 [Dothistroma septosporum NZE10]